MKNTAIFILMPLFYLYSHAVSEEVIRRSKTENSSFSKDKHDPSQNKTTTSTSATATSSITTLDDCNSSAVFDSDTERIRRSIHHVLENTTTTESPPDTTVDLSILSDEFLNCTHVALEPESYENRPDGSVFVPIYNTLFDRSNHIIDNKRLYVCADQLSGDNSTLATPTLDTSTLYDCNASANFDSDSERKRRSIQYVLENSTTTESPRNTTPDISIFSLEFRSCSHTYIEPECYQKLENGSVFVPFYNVIFDVSDYLIQEEFLFVCPEKLFGETWTEPVTKVIDICNVSGNSDDERSRRSIHYVLDNITTTETPPDTTIDISHLSEKFLNCTHIYLEPECYEKRPDGSVFVPLYNAVFDRSNYLINNQLLFVCSDIISEPFEHKFTGYFSIISRTGSIISTICIILHIIMFAIVKKLRNLPGYVLLSLCFALIGAYICTFVQEIESINCTVLGMFMVYFFLASFFWMNVMAYDVWKSIRLATAKLRLSTNRPFIVQYARYSFYAWGSPLMIVIISIIIHFSSPEDSKYKLTFDEDMCWFKYKTALALYFAGPLFVLIIVNISFLVYSLIMITNASKSISQSKSSQGNSDLWSRLFFSLRLGSVMGFMWIFGFISAVTKQEWLWYLYSLCSALQGVFIFFSFTVSERARKAYTKAIQKGKCSTIPTQTTSQQGTSF